jgi:hypothetical protein
MVKTVRAVMGKFDVVAIRQLWWLQNPFGRCKFLDTDTKCKFFFFLARG